MPFMYLALLCLVYQVGKMIVYNSMQPNACDHTHKQLHSHNLPHTTTTITHAQEVDRIEPVLYPLLRHDLARQGPRFVVDVGDKQIDYNDTFRSGFAVFCTPLCYEHYHC